MSTTNTNTAVATKTNADILRSRLQGEHFKSAVMQVLPKHLTPERFVRVALMSMTRVPKLADCDQASFIQCLLTLSQLGLEPDGRRAHLIPFGKQCQLIIDYKGYVELLMNTGQVSNIHADIVCENDVFEWDCGEVKKHTFGWEDRGKVLGAYAIIRFKDGTQKADRMSRTDIESIRKRSRAANAGPWVTDWNEMAKKTVFRRLVKWAKLSPEQRDAVEADDDQFEGAKEKIGKFGADMVPQQESPGGLFTMDEERTMVDVAEPKQIQETATEAKTILKNEPTVTSTATAHVGSDKKQSQAKATELPLDGAKSESPLVSEKTLLSDWMIRNKFTWAQIQPVLVAEGDQFPWADSVGSFDDLTNDQAKAVRGARSGIESILKSS